MKQISIDRAAGFHARHAVDVAGRAGSGHREVAARGVQDIFSAFVDVRKGNPEAIETVFPRSTMQLCIVHGAAQLERRVVGNTALR